jgi:Cft2 family RNA processing exonuclease
MAECPSPKISAISGLGSKGPACFLVETGTRRLLLDLGYGPDPGARPDLDRVGRIDAVILSHSHRDHSGSLDLLPEIGDPPLYASTLVAARLQRQIRPLPLSGASELLGLPIITGRNGHAPGGMWIHLGIGRGLLYMGDYSTESLVYAADAPPPAATIVLDASYGDDDMPLARQQAALAAMIDGKAVLLPVPADGRGPEIALHLARRGGVDLRLDAAMRASLQRLAERERAALRGGVAAELGAIARSTGPIDGTEGVMLATPADASRGEAANLIAQWQNAAEPAIVFTGYLPQGTPAQSLVQRGRAKFMRWNVHPRLSDNVTLVRAVGADVVLPAFCAAKYFDALAAAFAPAKVFMDSPVAL